MAVTRGGGFCNGSSLAVHRMQACHRHRTQGSIIGASSGWTAGAGEQALSVCSFILGVGWGRLWASVGDPRRQHPAQSEILGPGLLQAAPKLLDLRLQGNGTGGMAGTAEAVAESLGFPAVGQFVLHRLTHHVDILEMNGDSYRLKGSRQDAGPQSPDCPEAT